MRVFVYEHLCARLDANSPLAAEGRAMLDAAVADLAAIVVEVTATPQGSDFALVIAPEFDDLLASRCEWALEAGCRLLGPSPEAVRLCADKLRLAAHLRDAGVPVPKTTAYGEPPSEGYPFVVKPRRGAGAQSTFVVRTPEEYRRAGSGERIAQPYVRGRPGSVAVLAGPAGAVALVPAEQAIEEGEGGQLSYAGGSVCFPAEVDVSELAAAVARSLPGTFGYFGIDFVADGDRITVIEVNPRLTTSYVGLRRLSRVNLMGALLDAALGRRVDLSWRTGRVRFAPDGSVW